MKIKSYSKACKDSGSETQSTNKWKFVEELEKDLTLKSCLDKLENKRKNSYVHIKRMKSKTSLNSYSDMINKSQRPYRDGMVSSKRANSSKNSFCMLYVLIMVKLVLLCIIRSSEGIISSFIAAKGALLDSFDNLVCLQYIISDVINHSQRFTPHFVKFLSNTINKEKNIPLSTCSYTGRNTQEIRMTNERRKFNNKLSDS